MAHPYADLREDKVSASRVAHLTKASGGGIGTKHSDEAQDKSLVRKMVKSDALKVEGRKNGGRLDRYARGGAVKKGATNVNVIIAPQGGGDKQAAAMPMPPMPGGPSPMPPPRPPMAPLPGMPAGGPQATGQAPLPIRKDGGRVGYKAGGAVKSGPTWEEGKRNGTHVQHSDGKNDGKDIRTTKPITYKKGGRVEAFGMGPKMKAGAESGEGRLEKTRLQKRK